MQQSMGEEFGFTPNQNHPETTKKFYLNQIPILTVANLKGGVGKTTVAANIGAYFAVEHNERVLFIDLDFQGSLSSMLIRMNALVPPDGTNSPASELVGGRIRPDQIALFAKNVERIPTGSVLQAYYDLARHENRTMVHWLTGKERRDARYLLAELLHSNEVRNAFDRIIIDAAPRMTMSTVQALSASTHVVIPTILDQLSGTAVATFVDQLISHKSIWPHLKIIGVAPQLTNKDVGAWIENNADEDAQNALTVAERAGYASINVALKRVQNDHNLNVIPAKILPYDTFIQRKAEIAESAGRSVALLDVSAQSRNMFRRLGLEVMRQMPRG